MFHSIQAIGRRFLRDTGGGAGAIAAAGVIVMTLGGTALIVDHNHLVGQRDILKGAADAASMAATLQLNSVPSTMPDDEVENAVLGFARKYAVLNVLGNISDPGITAEDITITFDLNLGSNTAGATVTANTGRTLISEWLYGYSGPGAVTAEAGVESADTVLEVVLAIDTSQSMDRNLDGDNVGHANSSSRMAIVREAAVDLVNVLQPSTESRVAVGVVPWDVFVRLDPTMRASWATNGWAVYPRTRYFGAPYACAPEGSCTATGDIQTLPANFRQTWRGCLDEHRMNHNVANLTADDDWFDHPSQIAFARAIYPSGENTSYRCYGNPLPGNMRFQHCYGPRHRSRPWRVLSNLSPQEQCPNHRPSILPLSTNQTAIVRHIRGLRPARAFTHSSLGLLWGQRLLTPAWRDVWGDREHPVDQGADVRKAIVLLTDGNDTICGDFDTDCSRTGMGYDRAGTCTAVKAAGSEIFVVAAMRPRDVSGELGNALTACSSQGDRPGTYTFLNNSDAATLRAAFTSIATQLRSVRRIY